MSTDRLTPERSAFWIAHEGQGHGLWRDVELLDGMVCDVCMCGAGFVVARPEASFTRTEIGELADRIARLQDGDGYTPDFYLAAQLAEDEVRAMIKKKPS